MLGFCLCMLCVQLSDEAVEETETAAQEAVLAMVVRLSENAFRPMFYKVGTLLSQHCVSAGMHCVHGTLMRYLSVIFVSSCTREF